MERVRDTRREFLDILHMLYTYRDENGIHRYQMEPLHLNIRKYPCKRCWVLKKRGDVKYDISGEGVICRGTCVRRHFSPIPDCISRLNQNEKNSLRTIKIYGERTRPNRYMYERYSGTLSLSLNWDVWRHYSGLIGFGNAYNMIHTNYTNDVIIAMRWLIQNNIHYQNLRLPTAIDSFMRVQPSIIGGQFNGILFHTLRVPSQANYGRDDTNWIRIPLGEWCAFNENDVRQVIGPTLPNKEAYLFPYLFPDGVGFFTNHDTARSTVIKDLIFRYNDSRFRDCSEYQFYQFDFAEKYRVANHALRGLRNNNPENRNMTVESILDISVYDGTTIFSDETTVTMPITVRGSSAYFKKIKCDLLCFIEQLGNPHLFLTFSCDEEAWPRLTEYLRQYGTFDNTLNGTIQTQNPVLCNHYCYERLRSILNLILSDGYAHIPIKHHFVRYEFQKRGSVHCHLLLWLEHFDVEYLVHTISGQIPPIENDPLLHQLVKYYQYHTCSNYCIVNGQCKFNYPQPVSQCSYYDFINNVYVLRRNRTDVRINSYNSSLMRLWRGNMDVKIITSENIVHYVLKYVSKEEPFEVEQEVRNEYLRYIEKRSYTLHEISHYLTGNKITEFSIKVVRIQLCVSLLDQRYIRRISDIRNLDPDSTDIYYKNALDLYCSRPQSLENLTILQYFSQFEKCRNGNIVDQQGKTWKRLSVTRVVRCYPFYTQHQAELYFGQIILKRTNFRNAGNLLQQVTPFRDYVYSTFDDHIQDQELVGQVMNEPDADLLHNYTTTYIELSNLYSFQNNLELINTSNLNGNQYQVYNRIINSTERLFTIEGGPGTGKSYLTKALYSYCVRQNFACAITASTGIAAFNIGGCTIHSFLMITNQNNTRYRTLIGNGNYSNRLQNLNFLIIDEFSMIGASLFNFIMSTLNDQNCTNVKIILVGDLLQLPPVNDEYISDSPYFSHFTRCYLTLQNRVQDETLLYQINNINVVTDFTSLLNFINDRLTSTIDDNSPFVYSTRRECRLHNNHAIRRLATPIMTFRYPNSTALYSNNHYENEFRLPYTLNLCIGARVMLLKNLNIQTGLVNGTIGTVVNLQFNQFQSYAVVEFFTPPNAQILRISPTREYVDDVFIQQLPLQLAYATTIHKCQGLTLSKIVVGPLENMRHTNSKALLYVAMSRVKYSDNIRFLRVRPNPYQDFELRRVLQIF
eukprot:NODE_139_length_16235_cov_0.569038.p1 type:complete len:1194 gc:universal NODE_139_length_16235_cov_0.569038:9032-12613(+)